MRFQHTVLATAITSALLVGCNSSDDDSSSFSLDVAQGSVASLNVDADLQVVTYEKDGVEASLPLTIGYGSGAYHASADSASEFYTITDRGPNIACGDSANILGVDELCGAGNEDGKIFPVADFAPMIVKWKLSGTPGNYSAEAIETITLKKTDGTVVSGLTNDLVSTDTEGAFDLTGASLDFDNNGLDPEALVKLSDGTFWISEEYGPSIVHVSATGEIIERVVPASVAADLSDAGYPVSGALPDVLKKRKLNRGIESIALSPDEDALYFAMQSPLANPDADAYKSSRHLRVFKYALNADGSLGAQAGEYVYELDYPQSFADTEGNGDVSTKQNNVKVSEMLAIGDDDLVILERITNTTKLYRISLATGDNIMSTDISDATVMAPESDESKTLEQVFDPSALDAVPVTKELVFNSLTDMPSDSSLPAKVEGIALLDADHLLLINDNDFGIAGEESIITILPTPAAMKATAAPQRLSMSVVGRYESGVFDESAAEIVDYHAASERVFVVNANNKKVDILDLSSLTNTSVNNAVALNNLALVGTLDVQADVTSVELGAANSVSVHDNLLAVAVENDDKQANGIIAFYDVSGATPSFISFVTVGALPDMVKFTPDGTKVLVANEGEPNSDYTVDPEGSVSVISVTNGVPATTATTLDFTAFNVGGSRHDELSNDVRIFGPGATVAQDLEPEYIAINSDNSKAFVALQEANAIAELDLETLSITAIYALGTKDFSEAGNEIDASDKDDAINFALHEGVVGMYQPDTIATMSYMGMDLVFTANEGDSRDYDAYSEEERAEDLIDGNLLDADNASYAAAQDEERLGRLKVTTATGDTDGDGDIDVIHNYGARSFSIWADGMQVFDSHSDIGKITAGRLGLLFNGEDKRSDDKGAEPEAMTLGTIGERTYAFVGLERTSGIMVYDVTNPYGVQFVDYVENIDRSLDEEVQGDVAPEGMRFISAEESPNGNPLLVVANEVSGSTTVYQLTLQ